MYMLYTYQQVLHLIENDEAYKQKEPTGRRKAKERNKDRQRERKKDRKKGKKEQMTHRQQTEMVIIYMYITLNTTFTRHVIHTYQQMLQLIENDEAYKQKEPTGKKEGDREKQRKRERKKERKNSDKSQ